jgi:AraC-like DNA-binding protein
MAVFTPGFLDSCDLDMKQLADASHVLSSAGPLIRLEDDSLPRVRDAFQTLAEYIRLPPARFANRAIGTAFSLLVFTLAGLPETAASAAAQKPQDALVERFLRQLEDHFASEHQAQYYAKALHVSLRSLDRHVVAAHAQTTRQAISARLVLEAKRLLTRREMLVKNIACELGFSETQNFTRFFRTQTGLSPKAFRQMFDR